MKGFTMAEKLQVYKCSLCSNMVEVVHSGDGEMACCGQAMEKLIAKTDDQGKEKHVPVIEKADGQVTVKVGSIAHPMEQEHYIEWIEIISDGKAYRQFLNPGDTPEAVFNITGDAIIAKESCTIHGIWKGQ